MWQYVLIAEDGLMRGTAHAAADQPDSGIMAMNMADTIPEAVLQGLVMIFQEGLQGKGQGLKKKKRKRKNS